MTLVCTGGPFLLPRRFPGIAPALPALIQLLSTTEENVPPLVMAGKALAMLPENQCNRFAKPPQNRGRRGETRRGQRALRLQWPLRYGILGHCFRACTPQGALPSPMNDFVRRLPWRLGALGGLLVGGISLAGGVDLWACLLRAGIALAVFGGLGLGLRALMEAGTDGVPAAPSARREEPGARSGQTGTHVDQKTPPMTPGDLPKPDERSPGER